MCLIVHRPQGVSKINDAWFEDFWKKNDDGFGAGWYVTNEDQKTVTLKYFKTLDKGKALEIIRTIEEHDREAILHFRMATHGRISVENCHPFAIGSQTLLFHNGILSNFLPVGGRTSEKTDTEVFGETFVRPLVKKIGAKWLFSVKDPLTDVLASVVGYNNRIAFMHPQFGTILYGTWTEWKGMKLSNTYAWSYECRNMEEPKLYSSAYGRGWDDWHSGRNADSTHTSGNTTTPTNGESKSALVTILEWSSVLRRMVKKSDKAKLEEEHLKAQLDKDTIAKNRATQAQLPHLPQQSTTKEEPPTDLDFKLLVDLIESMTTDEILQWVKEDPDEIMALLKWAFIEKHAKIS